MNFKYVLFFCIGLLTTLSSEEPKKVSEKLGKASARLLLEYLSQTADEKSGLWLPPLVHENVKYVKTGEFIEVEEPILEVVGYEDIWRWVAAPTDNDPYKKVYKKTKKPIYKKVGVKKVKREKSKPSSEKSSVSISHNRWEYGINGFPAYALMNTGMDFRKDKNLDKTIEWLADEARRGLPDNTIDLCVSALTLMKADPVKYDQVIQDALYKILKGQINQGTVKGLWGYYCVNWKDVAELNKQLTRIGLLKSKLKLPKKPNRDNPSKAYQLKLEKYDELESGEQWVVSKMKGITREFYLGRRWFEHRSEKDDDPNGDGIPYHYRYPKMLYNAREQREGDIFYTQVALFTILEAKKLGFFELSKTKAYAKRQKLTLRKAALRITLPAFPKYEMILIKTAAAIKKEQNKEGFWKDVNKKVKTINVFPEMRKLKSTRKELSEKVKKLIKKNEYPKVDRRDGDTISAMHSYALLTKILGASKIKTRYKASIEKGLKTYNEIILKTMASEDWKLNSEFSFMPYTLLFSMPDIHEEFGVELLKDASGSRKALDFIVKIQNEDGTFNKVENRNYRYHYRPCPWYPESTQDEWVKIKMTDDWNMRPNVKVQTLSVTAIIYFYQRMMPSIFKGPEKWETLLVDFNKMRESELGIESNYIKKLEADALKEAEEAAKAKLEAEAKNELEGKDKAVDKGESKEENIEKE